MRQDPPALGVGYRPNDRGRPTCFLAGDHVDAIRQDVSADAAAAGYKQQMSNALTNLNGASSPGSRALSLIWASLTKVPFTLPTSTMR